jgi:outer membrane protein TolC
MKTHAFRRGAGGLGPPLAAILAGPLLLAACAGPGLGARHRELARSFDAATPGAAQSPAEDDAFASASSLERERLVAEVLRRNPSLAAARHAWRAALERYPQETSLEDPMLGAGVAPRSFGSSAVDDGFRLDLSQRLPFPGKLSLRGEVALAEAEAAADDFEGVRLRLAELASRLFDDSYLSARAAEINAAHVALLESLRRAAVARYEAGEGSQQDPLQAEVEHAHALHDAERLRTKQRLNASRINVLLHRAPGAPLPPPPARLARPAQGDPDEATLVARALRERPDLRAAAARERGQEAAVALARREFMPDVTVTGAYDRIWQEKELQPFVGLSLELPIRIDRRRAALAEARARHAAAASERAALEDEARFEVEAGIARLEEAHHVLELLESRLLPAARDRAAAARTGFETGRSGFDLWIEAERELRDAQLDRETALADASRRQAELLRAIGASPVQP